MTRAASSIAFQSQNGLILTIEVNKVKFVDFYFNPKMVLF